MHPSPAKSGHWTTMALALLVWLCALPLIFLVATPFLGWKVAGLIALGLLLVLLPVCWAICVFKIKNCNDMGR